ncbi:MAG: phosphate ABC transporter permease PstA [Hyphomicrobiales bacterium]|nr:phosphate ABC transporter permease PstA [Hyphomicrobiales bacterium]
MTDIAPTGPDGFSVHTSADARRRLARRYAAERRFRHIGLAAVVLAMGFLLLLLLAVIAKAIPAFTYTYAVLPVDLAGDRINRDDPLRSNFDAIVKAAIAEALPFASGRKQRRVARGLISSGAAVILRDRVADDPALAGAVRTIGLPVSDTLDLYFKKLTAGRTTRQPQGSATPSATNENIRIAVEAGVIGADEQFGRNAPSHLVFINGGVVKITGADGQGLQGDVLVPLQSAAPAAQGDWRLMTIDQPESARKISDREIAYAEKLNEKGLIERRFNAIFFTRGASREPEMAGVWGAVVGSFFTMLVTLALSFPLGVASAVYLEEVAPKNRWTQLIEVNINNLAAVPSIVFGLLGLAVFLNFFGLPRSAPVAGGMVLALMTLPTIIIASRAALGAVPPSIREAALGIGASQMQTVFHHVLPLAMPGILTGTILGVARALGETAPLLMIGMVAFIVDIPGGALQPATVLPVQIYMWADFPEPGFQQKTAAAILVLLGFLVVMNAAAVLMRQRFERRW